jgi:hypothetical protein
MVRYNGIEIDMRNRIISHAGIKYFTVGRQRFKVMCALVLAGPISMLSIFELLYSEDLDGGPIQGVKQIAAFVNQLQPACKALQLEIHVCKLGGITCYELVPSGTPLNGRRYYATDLRTLSIAASRMARKGEQNVAID